MTGKKGAPLSSIVGLSVALLSFPLLQILIFLVFKHLGREWFGRFDPEVVALAILLLSVIIECCIGICMISVILFWEREPLGSIGLRRIDLNGVMWGFVGVIVAILLHRGILALAHQYHLPTRPVHLPSYYWAFETLTRGHVPIWLLTIMVIILSGTAAINEEILYRGYVIERLSAVSGSMGISATLSCALFVLCHLPLFYLAWQDVVGGVIAYGIFAVVITILYVKRRSLASCMLMHFLYDAIAFSLIAFYYYSYFSGR